MGLGATRIGEPTRRDRLLLINAFAMVLLTMLGAAGESLGMDRLLKSNTSKIRTHSLFRQGCMLYELIPTILVIPSFCGLLAWRKEKIRKGQNLVETNPGGPRRVRLLLSG